MATKLLRTVTWLCCTGALALSSTAQAQQRTDPNIVVTGQHPLSEDETLDVVRKVARPVDGQLARYRGAVCPKVIGFEPRYEEIVAARMRATADKIGVETAGPGCDANLLVMIVDDGRDFVAEMLRSHPEAFEGLSKAELDRLTEAEAPARAWTLTLPTNAMGAVAGQPSSSRGTGSVRSGFGGSSVAFGEVNTMRAYGASNVNPTVQQSIVASWVVLETGATLGKTLTQLADYAAMRGLAMVEPSELMGEAPTILDLFEAPSRTPQSELTGFDLAYLQSLYKAPGMRWARSQVRYMADAMARENGTQRN